MAEQGTGIPCSVAFVWFRTAAGLGVRADWLLRTKPAMWQPLTAYENELSCHGQNFWYGRGRDRPHRPSNHWSLPVLVTVPEVFHQNQSQRNTSDPVFAPYRSAVICGVMRGEFLPTSDWCADALQPPLCAESSEINARRCVPSARAIPSAELLRRFLVAVGNAKRRVAASVLPTRSWRSRSNF